jgi:hypothetical protein
VAANSIPGSWVSERVLCGRCVTLFTRCLSPHVQTLGSAALTPHRTLDWCKAGTGCALMVLKGKEQQEPLVGARTAEVTGLPGISCGSFCI